MPTKANLGVIKYLAWFNHHLNFDPFSQWLCNITMLKVCNLNAEPWYHLGTVLVHLLQGGFGVSHIACQLVLYAQYAPVWTRMDVPGPQLSAHVIYGQTHFLWQASRLSALLC